MKQYKKQISIIALAIASLVYLGTKSFVFTSDQRSSPKNNTYYTVSRVIDGDTIVLSDGRRVRLIGIDTPEVYFSAKLLRDSKKSGRDIKTIQGFGKRASAFTKELCFGKKVILEYDIERYDRYKRTLAYVFLEDGTFVNAKIVQEGFAQVMTVVPNVKYANLFLKLQQEAREASRGLWRT